jgi:hypothetical protein
MADHNFRCGDALICTSRYNAEQLNIHGLHGIVMGTKPHHIHVWFEGSRRGYWINYEILRKVEDLELSRLEDRIQFFAYSLNAEEWELEENPENYTLLCYVDEIPLETLQELRAYLDIDYVAISLGPEGMGRMITRIQWAK